jgi:hypothetical protein
MAPNLQVKQKARSLPLQFPFYISFKLRTRGTDVAAVILCEPSDVHFVDDQLFHGRSQGAVTCACTHRRTHTYANIVNFTHMRL